MPVTSEVAGPVNSCRQAESASILCDPLSATLSELASVVGSLTSEQFVQRCGESFANGCIGSHVRHCLDHIRAVVETPEGFVDYDRRVRGTDIERDPGAALREARRLQGLIGLLVERAADEQVCVRVIPTRDGGTVEVESTLARELAFVLSHTVHHNALVRAMAGVLGASMPPLFGYAPSTLAHRDSALCAR